MMTNHSTRLEALAELHQVSSLTLLEFFLERAAIREYGGAQSRAEAEMGAMEDVEEYLARR